MKSVWKFNGAAVAAAALGCVLTAAPALAAANLVSNGDFSSPNVGTGWALLNSTQSGGWSNTDPAGVEIGGSLQYGLACANAACQNLEVNANTFGDVSQTLTGLTKGDEYSLAFDYGGRPGYGVQKLDVLAGGSALDTSPLTGSYGVWTPYTFTFVADGTSETIAFKSEITSGSPGGGNEITNVSVTAVPEPATWAMLILGVAMVGFAARRRNEAAAVAA